MQNGFANFNDAGDAIFLTLFSVTAPAAWQCVFRTR